MSYDGARGRQRGRDRGRLRLARVADAAPHGSLPRPARAARRADGRGAPARRSSSRASLEGVEAEVYVTAPGAEIEEGHPLVARSTTHAEVFGAAPERDVTRWFSDASVLTRYGIATVNYGTSSGSRRRAGENLEIDGLVKTAEVYARAASGSARSVTDRRPVHAAAEPAGARGRRRGRPPARHDAAAAHPRVDAGAGLRCARSRMGLLVLYVYPRAGRPGVPSLPGWDEIPGARGCTPQSLGFREALRRLSRSSARSVAGLSAQPLDDQLEFAERNQIPYPILADPELLARRSAADVRGRGQTLYKRLALVVEAARSRRSSTRCSRRTRTRARCSPGWRRAR